MMNTIEWLEKRLKEIEVPITEAIAVNENWKQKMDLLINVPGIGKLVAVILILSLVKIKNFNL
jgi:hypothetical protein